MQTGKLKSLILGAAAVAAWLGLGAGAALGAHPDIPLYTYEEIGMQIGAQNNMVPVMLNSVTMKGMPYSPKQTCGNCHNGGTDRWDGGGKITDASGNEITAGLVSYEEMSTQAFHAELGAEEWQDIPDTETTQPGKPWSETSGMFGKW